MPGRTPSRFPTRASAASVSSMALCPLRLPVQSEPLFPFRTRRHKVGDALAGPCDQHHRAVAHHLHHSSVCAA
ncbi:hypothetical protein PF005_g20838 [Phytophthora fragariae]|uniref:Uncharacterized protein n=2 Tax=Phytophthora TaxID=4783 RepID=A0A6A3E7V3_9STRA|nr:hypothetical protein PF003_g12217 [Phytophthora fragariae]KAE8987428.1 hypothetical protein PR002_g22053 [Phytophthora rubi]KAE8927961.1 hypothetical protein PF009_g21880 [Phytophthora fragariae]KAE8990550.1 hypothetical protein PR001_g21457 [Phytophthora rubi]KAE9089410.1 hypothetical protein PF007_g19612 [Phytophthora fragariae]